MQSVSLPISISTMLNPSGIAAIVRTTCDRRGIATEAKGILSVETAKTLQKKIRMKTRWALRSVFIAIKESGIISCSIRILRALNMQLNAQLASFLQTPYKSLRLSTSAQIFTFCLNRIKAYTINRIFSLSATNSFLLNNVTHTRTSDRKNRRDLPHNRVTGAGEDNSPAL